MGGQTGPVFYIYHEGMRHPPPILTRKKEFDLSKRKHGPTIVPALSAKVDNKEKRFIQVGNSQLLSKQFHALSTGSRFLYFCMAMESGGRKNLILPQKDAKMAQGVNPRSRLIHFSKNSSFHYFTVDEMGLRLMKLTLDETMLYRFQRYLQQNGICKASMLPLYLFSLELLSEAYALKKGKQMRAELDRGALFSCQADVVKRICNTGPNLITIPDKWLLDLDMERDDRSDELLLSPNATFLSQQSGM